MLDLRSCGVRPQIARRAACGGALPARYTGAVPDFEWAPGIISLYGCSPALGVWIAPQRKFLALASVSTEERSDPPVVTGAVFPPLLSATDTLLSVPSGPASEPADPVPSAGVRRFLAAVNNGGLQLHLLSKSHPSVDLQVK
jgi:hypothetical protein